MFLALILACTPKPAEPAPAVEAAPVAPPEPAAPATRREDVVDTLHGVAVADPYRWLEDEKAAEVQAWMGAYDTHTRHEIGKLGARSWLARRFRELYYVDAVGVPTQRGERLFYSRRLADQDKAVLYWRASASSPEQVLIDPNNWAGDVPRSLGDWFPSDDGSKLAYTEKANAADESTLRVLDVNSGELSNIDLIPGAKYASVDWTPDGKGFYYEWLPTDSSIPVDERPGYTELRYHALGSDPASDRQVHPRTGNPATFLDGTLSDDGNYLWVSVFHGWNASDVWVKDLRKDKDFRPLSVGAPALYLVDEHKDELYILTDEGAPRKRIFKTSTRKLDRKAWKEIVPEDPAATLDSFAIVGGKLVLTYMKDVKTEVRWASLDGKATRVQSLPGVGVASLPSGEKSSKEAYFSFSSFTSPPQVYSLSVSDLASKLWAKIEIPIDTSKYVSEQVWYTSKDGTRVPMFLVHRADVVAGGRHPALLHGYGGFDVSMAPDFRSARYPFLEAGGVYAIANLRGGGEFGKAWHEAGQLDKKQNVFDDFAAAARYLIDQGWTTPEKLAINGGSNGGLLVGAAMTQHPELYRAVVCAVPLLDMVRYHQFGSGRTWIPEYGSAEDPAQFPTLLAYSPYHNVKAGANYPDLLMLAADHDDRVDPMHARKFVAAIAAADQGGRPPLLRIEKNAGHGGADKVAQSIEYSADMYAFIFDRLGMTAPE
ncbi:MAG: S9 family peptidase [Deltaproteobacteria bacterium]|nr:S9 family peptidase [Deltaproteobacteria bacterium]